MTTVASQIQHAVQSAVVDPVVVPVANLADVQRQVFLADVVKLPDDGAAHDGPKRLNGVGVRRSKTAIKRFIPLRIGAGMIDHAVRDRN